MKQIKQIWFDIKWYFIRTICKLLYRNVMIEQKFLNEMNLKLNSGYENWKNKSYRTEGRLYTIHNRCYVSLGKSWFIYIDANKHIQKFFENKTI